jgi:hypothetical protein
MEQLVHVHAYKCVRWYKLQQCYVLRSCMWRKLNLDCENGEADFAKHCSAESAI